MNDAVAPRLADYLGHMLAAIERIEEYTKGIDAPGFLVSRLVQDAVIRNLEILGEAANKIGQLDPAFAAAHPELPLAAAYQMRNAIAHGYFKVDFNVVWTTIQSDLPALRVRLQAVLAHIDKR